MSLALRLNRLNTSTFTLTSWLIRYPTRAYASVVAAERWLLSSINGRGPKIARLELAKPRTELGDGRANRRHPIDRTGNEVAHVATALNQALGEARVGRRQIQIEEQPRSRDIVIVPLDAVPLARPVRFSIAGVAGEHEFRAQPKLP